MGTLKEKIQHEVHLFERRSIENGFMLERKVKSKNMTTRKLVINNYRENHAPSPYLTQPTRLTPQKIDEIITEGLFFNCDNKYNKGNIYGENKLFEIDCEEEEDHELEP